VVGEKALLSGICRDGIQFSNEALAAWSSGIDNACRRGDWSYGLWDQTPPGCRVVAFLVEKKKKIK
jgi:hypothetical protein